jgi:hypothetical protein
LELSLTATAELTNRNLYRSHATRIETSFRPGDPPPNSDLLTEQAGFGKQKFIPDLMLVLLVY